MTLRVGEALSGKHLVMTGVTGFVGKTVLAWLMCHHPDVARITCIIRRKGPKLPADRLRLVLDSDPLQVVRDTLGDALEGFIDAKVHAIQGDLSKTRLGVSDDDLEALQGADVLLNVAASVDFTPPLDQALSTNAEGAMNALQLCRETGMQLLHVSTCYVAGYATGAIPELIDPKACPKEGVKFDADKELAIARRMVARIREDKDDPIADRPRRRLRADGEARARALGWPNTYTYTKALAEKLIVRHAGDVPFTIARLAIVESAWRFPLPGWSEGGNGSAACVLMAHCGQRWNPSDPELVLDLVPVDLVAKGLLVIATALINGRHQTVYHLGTSGLNPLTMRRVNELVNVWRHKMADEEGRGRLERLFLTTTDSMSGRSELFERTSAPAFSRVAGTVSSWLKDAPIPTGGRLARAADRVRAVADAVDRTAKGVSSVYDVYGPFILEIDVRYKCNGILALCDQLADEERGLYHYDAAELDWYDYFLDVHLPGLSEWIFPDMLRRLRLAITPHTASPRPMSGDLVDLLERSVASHAMRPAVGEEVDGKVRTWTYTELQRRAELAGRELVAAGVEPGDRVVLWIGRSPRWPMVWFAIQYAGATAVPIDPAATGATTRKLGERAGAKVWVVADDLAGRLRDQPVPDGVTLLLAEDLARPHVDELPALPDVPRDPHRAASILFTSGTTGTPRGVVLSHRNFLTVVRGIQGVYSLFPRDRFLSLLPLHHAFEFTAGLLYPVSIGASVVYPKQLSAEDVPRLLHDVRPTALVAVPALWTKLQQRIRERLDQVPVPVRRLLDEVGRQHGELRDKTGINLGPLLFLPVHRRLGALKHMVSGGAALPEAVLRDFYRWGFDLTSGYGLTEAAPVLTVAPPGTKRPESVGPSILGVDVRIHEPGPDGIGEVIARGSNIMDGYLDDPTGTGEAVQGGWLHTGDLGKLEDGHLVLVGRAKEVIVSASGENVYPDELQEVLEREVGDVVELAVVGLPNPEGGERVAAVIVVDDDSASEADIRRSIARATKDLPAAWRPAEIRVRTEALPRTATLKVQRSALAAECAAEDASRAVASEAAPPSLPPTSDWLVTALARAGGQRPERLHAGTRLGVDLPVDSLGWMDVVGVIERHVGRAPPVEELTALATVGQVVETVIGRRGLANHTPRVPLFYGADGHPAESVVSGGPKQRIPQGMKGPVSSFAKQLHARLSGTLMDIDVRGQGHIPEDRPVLVVSNHCSHLDSGILRHALGPMGDDLPLLAAQDYFFGNATKDLIFGDLLDLVPADRHSIGLSGVRNAVRILREGRSLAVFPEGTRSRDGVLLPFRPGAILIALEAEVDILPVYIGGTHDILRAGGTLPRGRKAWVRVGQPITHAMLVERVRRQGQPLSAAADALRDSVVALSEGRGALGAWQSRSDEAAV